MQLLDFHCLLEYNWLKGYLFHYVVCQFCSFWLHRLRVVNLDNRICSRQLWFWKLLSCFIFWYHMSLFAVVSGCFKSCGVIWTSACKSSLIFFPVIKGKFLLIMHTKNFLGMYLILSGFALRCVPYTFVGLFCGIVYVLLQELVRCVL